VSAIDEQRPAAEDTGKCTQEGGSRPSVGDATRTRTKPLPLTPQMLEALVGLARGETVIETASRLCKSPNTVKSQRAAAYRRLRAKNPPHAVALLLAYGLVHAEQVLVADNERGVPG
jgi:DNA-binding NarL/FixJ family response regulator